MTMIVKQELCTGCGACVNACPNGAILLNEGFALIDQAKCSSCQICARVCPTGALELSEAVITVTLEKPRASEVLIPQIAAESSPKRSGWGGTVLSLVSQYVLPRLIDILGTFLERRLSPPVQERTSMAIKPVENRPYRRHRQRHGRVS